MNHQGYLELLKSKYERHFEIETDIELFGVRLDMAARFSDISVRTFITKHDIIDRYENHEYCYVKQYFSITTEDIAEFGDFLKKIVNECIKPGKDHMSTYVTGVMVTDNAGSDIKKLVESYSYSRAYSFYLKGWCDVRLILVALDSSEVVTNKAGKRVKEVYKL